MEELVIYPSRFKMFLVAAAALLFVALALFIATKEDSVHFSAWSVVVIAYIGIPFFAACAAYAFYRLVYPRPSVVINREGLFDNASAVGAGMLKWEEIAEVFAYDFMGQRMLGIVPHNPPAVIARQPFFKRILARVNSGLVQAPFNIPQATLPISIDELLANIEERMVVTSEGCRAIR